MQQSINNDHSFVSRHKYTLDCSNYAHPNIWNYLLTKGQANEKLPLKILVKFTTSQKSWWYSTSFYHLFNLWLTPVKKDVRHFRLYERWFLSELADIFILYRAVRAARLYTTRQIFVYPLQLSLLVCSLLFLPTCRYQHKYARHHLVA